MDKAQSYALSAMGAVLLASATLWLVPGALGRVFDAAPAYALPLTTTRAQATAQVDSAVRALGAGLVAGDQALALSGCDAADPQWLAALRDSVAAVHARLGGHPARVLSTWGYWAPRYGRADEIATSRYGGALAIYDETAGAVVHAQPYRAEVRQGRFRLLPPTRGEEARVSFRRALGSIYHQELGMDQKALALWRGLAADLRGEQPDQRQAIHWDIADLCAARGDIACAYQDYATALDLTPDDRYTGAELGGKQIGVKTREWLQYRLARSALEMGAPEKARRWLDKLATAQSPELAAAARSMLADR